MSAPTATRELQGASKPRLIALGFSAAAGLALTLLLRRLLIDGQAQSFDAVLYARSLWGIAHGDFQNSVISYPSLAIHSQFGLLLLAPFARLARAVDVLIIAQALAFAGTLFVWLSALLEARSAAGRPSSLAPTALVAAWASLLFVYGMPLVANPFVFDVRPELLGVFAATAGLVRCAKHKRVDTGVLAWLLIAALAREEFALLAAMALVLAPVERTGAGAGIAWRTRLIWAGICVVYFAGNSYAWPRSVAQAAHLETDVAWTDLLTAKAMLIAAFVSAAGGLAMVGYRWLGAALPGAGILMLSTWMPDKQLSFHYSMFVAPGLLAASYAGYEQLLARPRIPRAAVAAHAVIALACGALASAFPGGAQFARPFFDVNGPLLSPASWQERSAWLVDIHELLATLPKGDALWLPYTLATPYADRASIRVLEVDNDQPWQPDTVVLPSKDWPTRGRALRQAGYQLAGLSRANFAVLSRKPSAPLSSVLSSEGCGAVAIVWPRAGLDLCNAWREPDGYVTVVLGRSAPHEAGLTGAHLQLSTGPADARVLHAMDLLDGLLTLDELPLSRSTWSRSPVSLSTSKVTFVLVDSAGQPIPLVANGQTRERITVTLPDDATPGTSQSARVK